MTTLRQLRFLVALSDTQNFSRAAELSNVTQSTLSSGLKELEARLGVKVAERTTHSVLMTPEGTDLAARARDILARVKDFEDVAKKASQAGVTRLRLGAIPTVGPYLLPPALPRIREKMPGVQIYLREELTDTLVSGLVEGRLDLALIALPHDLPSQIETELLFEDGYSLAAPRGHPLANLETVEGEDLAGRELLLLERGHCLQQHALSSVPGLALQEDKSFSATSLPTLVSMVEEGIGVTLLPGVATDAGLTKGHELHLSRLAGATPRRVVLVWRQSTAQAALFRQIADIFRDTRSSLRTGPAAH
ncbi:hydrogen peroxide-inducible genes activator [Rhodovulum sp. 12E13]|uniref:hydrogen peroxide-inducible genes activator n=1 Tax=Rhodovulum sp. 12E13 TaxID=2203891 RepID=UPI000E14904C|nr:hydrogen peroxide-inducible genes activator [Rhodovulum sp. 12E13]RDC69706.1 hydrogen peroxide-inducible genes activator [Rhodovulum sp. 12E13]